mgnify:CR=1 FL=1
MADKWETSLTSQAALVILPPLSQLSAVQKIRKEHDKAYSKWAPHVTLLYPFLPPSFLEQVTKLIDQGLGTVMHKGRVLREYFPLRVRLSSMQNSSGSKYVTLQLMEVDEEAQGTLLALHSFLHQKLYQGSDVGGVGSNKSASKGKGKGKGKQSGNGKKTTKEIESRSQSFHPHLTLGQWPQNQVDKEMHRMNEGWIPIEFEVGELSMMWRKDADAPYKAIGSITLGEPEEEEERTA